MCAALFMGAFAVPAHGQARVSGMVFADAQGQLHGTVVPADSSSFRFRRVQLTVDQELDTTFAVRLQLEADDNELTSKGKTTVFLKQAWLRWGHIRSFGDLYMGLSQAPTWALVEGYWGYRSLEKTVLDLQGLGSATDMGVALLRSPSASQPLGWHIMLSNGNGQKPENTVGKKLTLSVPYRFGDYVLEGMGDFEDERGTRDRWTTRVFGGWQKGADALGVEFYRRVNANAGTANADVVPSGASVFGRHKLTDHLRAVARVDFTDPDSNVDNAGYREMFFLAALDATPHANVHVMPNVLVRTYSAKGVAPERKADVTLRVTLHWMYK
jgi:hypothetical protein